MSNRSTLGAKLIAAPYIVWSVLFIIAPLIFVVYYSFTTADGSFTLDNMAELGKYAPTFLRSIWFGIVATVICLIIGYPCAFILSKMSKRHQGTMLMIVMLPMWMNFLYHTINGYWE